ncbi:MAG: sporulation transcription factor Spo0A [Clostridia bacterium]|nr:sporulation transcription factor Spo0A [Clostridia bacterium]
MKEEISILIADDNIEFGNLLNHHISQEPEFRVIGVAKDGIEAIEMIQSSAPDIVVLDIIMPNLDGIGVLERMAQIKLDKKPQFIMLSAVGHDLFIQKAIILGAEYYIVKPFELSVLVTRIRQVCGEKAIAPLSTGNKQRSTGARAEAKKEADKARELELIVTNLMRDVGIPPHLSGYQFLREAIIHAVNTSKVFSPITRVLYPVVAEKYNTTSQKVERAIRGAIESAWGKGNIDILNSLFGYTIDCNKGKPTNSEFIAMMADKVRLGMGKK